MWNDANEGSREARCNRTGDDGQGRATRDYGMVLHFPEARHEVVFDSLKASLYVATYGRQYFSMLQPFTF